MYVWVCPRCCPRAFSSTGEGAPPGCRPRAPAAAAARCRPPLQSSGSAVALPLVPPRSAGSSCTWHRAHVPCIDRRTLNYWAIRGVHKSIVKNTLKRSLLFLVFSNLFTMCLHVTFLRVTLFRV